MINAEANCPGYLMVQRLINEYRIDSIDGHDDDLKQKYTQARPPPSAGTGESIGPACSRTHPLRRARPLYYLLDTNSDETYTVMRVRAAASARPRWHLPA
jgi:hypothetical protein